MLSGISPEKAVRFTKWSVFLACAWPPSESATKREIIKTDLILCLSILNMFCIFVSVTNSIMKYITDPIILTQITTFCTVSLACISRSIILRLHRKKIQILIKDMEEFLGNCCEQERQVLQRYVDNCGLFHLMISCMNYYYAATALIASVFVIYEKKMIIPAVYPFSTESGLPYYFVLTQQTIFLYQASAVFTIDCQLAMILWFAGARLEILAQEINCFSNISNIFLFVDKHNQLLLYANRIAKIIPYFAFITTCVCGAVAITAAIQMVANPALAVKIRLGPGVLTLLSTLTISIWPAENMIRVCDSVGTAVYNLPWTDMSPKMMKIILMIVQRSQRPVQVSLGGFVPALSLHFYSSFLATIFSYFTTLRLAMSNELESSH